VLGLFAVSPATLAPQLWQGVHTFLSHHAPLSLQVLSRHFLHLLFCSDIGGGASGIDLLSEPQPDSGYLPQQELLIVTKHELLEQLLQGLEYLLLASELHPLLRLLHGFHMVWTKSSYLGKIRSIVVVKSDVLMQELPMLDDIS
jgi:hypothetical protein